MLSTQPLRGALAGHASRDVMLDLPGECTQQPILVARRPADAAHGLPRTVLSPCLEPAPDGEQRAVARAVGVRPAKPHGAPCLTHPRPGPALTGPVLWRSSRLSRPRTMGHVQKKGHGSARGRRGRLVSTPDRRQSKGAPPRDSSERPSGGLRCDCSLPRPHCRPAQNRGAPGRRGDPTLRGRRNLGEGVRLPHAMGVHMRRHSLQHIAAHAEPVLPVPSAEIPALRRSTRHQAAAHEPARDRCRLPTRPLPMRSLPSEQCCAATRVCAPGASGDAAIQATGNRHRQLLTGCSGALQDNGRLQESAGS
jgi:hypothetical protein